MFSISNGYKLTTFPIEIISFFRNYIERKINHSQVVILIMPRFLIFAASISVLTKEERMADMHYCTVVSASVRRQLGNHFGKLNSMLLSST